MFLDEVEVSVCAGRGGPGSASMHREKFAPRGGPDGGDGGRGGDVVAEADSSLNSLQRFQLSRSFKAASGGAGGPSRRHGADGQSSILSVPPGTLAWDAATGQLLADLDRDGATAVLAQGGKGGRGNVHFASPTHQAPRRRELGEPGVTRAIRLELRLIADIGLVGLPNAGKSTLLAQLTGARPKIAAYPFTTLSPNLGVADMGEGRVLTLADVPGLIEGAHEGAGLGLAFLKHLARTRVLVHLVDASLGEDASIAAYRQVTAEMEMHSPELSAKPTVLALNKLDLIEAGEGLRLQTRLAELLPRELSILGISATTGAGCAPLLAEAGRLLNRTPLGTELAEAESGGFRLYQGPRGLSREYSVERVGDSFRVAGESLERLIAVTDLDDDSSVIRLQRQLAKIGVEAALLQAGAQEGDEVQIGLEAFTFYPDPAPAGLRSDHEQPGR
ncbi:MAG TPA: GTPase ObgE [Candidatus Dormibacteraeota bacterium]|nr:GTPase ObgE [Candidatus Dormibacteraeota bacterium]